MYEYTCGICGKRVVVEKQSQIRRFCSKECHGAFMHRKRSREDKLQIKLPGTMKNVTDEGYVALVTAIVHQASWDVTHLPAGSALHIDAERFFESEFFSALTGLDGLEILARLREEYRERQRQKKGVRWA